MDTFVMDTFDVASTAGNVSSATIQRYIEAQSRQ